MNARRLLTFLAAALMTAGQTLIFAADTSARAQSTSPTVAAHGQPGALDHRAGPTRLAVAYRAWSTRAAKQPGFIDLRRVRPGANRTPRFLR